MSEHDLAKSEEAIADHKLLPDDAATRKSASENANANKNEAEVAEGSGKGRSSSNKNAGNPAALDGGYGWVVVFGSFLVHFFADGFVYSFGVIADSLVKEFNSSNTEVSIVLSLLTGLMLGVGPLASAGCNRYGCRLTTIAGALISAAGCFASYYATSMYYLIGSVGLAMGFGFGLMYCPAIVIVTHYFERRRSLATGITVCGAGAGTFVFSNVIGWLVGSFGWRKVFLIYTALVLVCVPCGALFRPLPTSSSPPGDGGDEDDGEADAEEEGENGEKATGEAREGRRKQVVRVIRPRYSRQHSGHRGYPRPNYYYGSFGREKKKAGGDRKGLRVEISDAEEGGQRLLSSARGTGVKSPSDFSSSNGPTTAATSSKVPRCLRTIKRKLNMELLADPIYLLYGVSNFLTSLGFNTIPMFMPMNAQLVLGLKVEKASTTVSAYGLANTFGRIVFGYLSDKQLPTRWGRDPARNRLAIYNLALVCTGVASCFVFALSNYPAYIAYCCFYGFTIGSYVCLVSVVLVDLLGVERMTNAFGLLLFIQGVATFMGPPIAGQLFDLTQRYDWTFVFCGVCLFISGIMLFAIPCLQQRRRSRK